jgi:hypothetical protein
MYKKSHICDSHVYAIPVSQLTTFGKAHQNRLTKESYQALIANFPSLTPQNWIKTAKLAAGEQDTTTFPSPRPALIPIRQGPAIGYTPEELLTTRPNADKKICAHINNIVEVHSHRIKRTASVSNALPPKRSKLQDTVNELLKLDIPMESLLAMAPELLELLN